MKKKISLNLTVTPQDYVNATEYLKKRSFMLKYSFIIVPLITFLVFILFIFWMSNDISRMRIPATLLVSAIPAFILWIVILSLPGLSPILLSRRVKKLINSSPYMQGETRITFTNEDIEFLRELTLTKMKWLAFIHAIESEREFFLYSSDNDYPIFIPKRAFKSDKDLDFVKYLITKKLAANQSLEFSTPKANTHRAKRRKRQFRNAGNSSFSRRKLAKISG